MTNKLPGIFISGQGGGEWRSDHLPFDVLNKFVQHFHGNNGIRPSFEVWIGCWETKALNITPFPSVFGRARKLTYLLICL